MPAKTFSPVLSGTIITGSTPLESVGWILIAGFEFSEYAVLGFSKSQSHALVIGSHDDNDIDESLSAMYEWSHAFCYLKTDILQMDKDTRTSQAVSIVTVRQARTACEHRKG